MGTFLSVMDAGPPIDRRGKVIDVRLERDVRAPSRARQAVDLLRPRLAPRTLNDVKLLVSELVTNSVEHAGRDVGSWVSIRVYLLPRAVRGEVTDPGPGFFPEPPRAPLHQRERGRGLYLVGVVSDRWGVKSDGVAGVWFELATSAA
jgi:anti-sigma regulatory factor (Ser/Thr protein kinase)